MRLNDGSLLVNLPLLALMTNKYDDITDGIAPWFEVGGGQHFSGAIGG